MGPDYRTGLLSTSILQYQALSGGNEKQRNPVSALSVNRPRNHGLPDGLLGKADRPNAGICLCPGRAVSGSFQVLVGWSESEEFFFLGLIKNCSSSVAMVVHGKDSSPARPILAGRRFAHNRRTRMAGSIRRGGPMRFALLILGIFAASGWIEKLAEAAQNYPWCAYYDLGTAGFRHCGFATFQQCLADVSGVGGNCSPSPYPNAPESHPSMKRQRHHPR